MTKIKVFAGICGFTTQIEAHDLGNYVASLALESECPNWKNVNEILGNTEIEVMRELFKDKKTGALDSKVFDTALATIPHVSCPVISGIFKALEISVGLALPKDASITFIEE